MVFYLIGFGVCLPLGVWLFRFWFDDLDTFIQASLKQGL